MKKFTMILILFFSIFISSITSIQEVSASWVYEGSNTWEEWDFWPFDKHYYKVDYFEDDAGQYFYFSKNLSGTTYWNQNGYASSATITYSTSQTVSSSTSKTISGSLGLKVPIKAVEISGELGYSSTKTTTFSYSESAAHTRTLDRNSPTGYYSLQATHNLIDHLHFVYDKETKNASWDYMGYGYLVEVQNLTPFISLRYTSNYHS